MTREIVSIDWPSLKSGTEICMKDFPDIKLLKLNNNKACYFKHDSPGVVVDIKLYSSSEHGEYYYFSMNIDDWHPLTTRLWNL